MSEDFAWFKEHYTDFQKKYGESFIAIKTKKILGVYDSQSILQVLCKYKIVQKNLFKWTELNSVRFYVIRKISTCQQLILSAKNISN